MVNNFCFASLVYLCSWCFVSFIYKVRLVFPSYYFYLSQHIRCTEFLSHPKKKPMSWLFRLHQLWSWRTSTCPLHEILFQLWREIVNQCFIHVHIWTLNITLDFLKTPQALLIRSEPTRSINIPVVLSISQNFVNWYSTFSFARHTRKSSWSVTFKFWRHKVRNWITIDTIYIYDPGFNLERFWMSCEEFYHFSFHF